MDNQNDVVLNFSAISPMEIPSSLTSDCSFDIYLPRIERTSSVRKKKGQSERIRCKTTLLIKVLAPCKTKPENTSDNPSIDNQAPVNPGPTERAMVPSVNSSTELSMPSPMVVPETNNPIPGKPNTSMGFL